MAMPERMSLRGQRDPEIERVVKRYGVVSANLMAAVLGFPNTPQDIQTVARIMERIATKDKLFQFVTQLHIHYGVSFAFSLQKRVAKAQLGHKHMRSERLAVFDLLTFHFDEILSDEELRTKFKGEKGALVADDFTRVGAKGFFWEDERRGEHTIPALLKKSKYYAAKLQDLKDIFNVTDLRVIWNLASWSQVNALLEALRALPDNQIFLITHSSSTFDPRHASRIVSMPLFHSPAVSEPVKLLEDN